MLLFEPSLWRLPVVTISMWSVQRRNGHRSRYEKVPHSAPGSVDWNPVIPAGWTAEPSVQSEGSPTQEHCVGHLCFTHTHTAVHLQCSPLLIAPLSMTHWWLIPGTLKPCTTPTSPPFSTVAITLDVIKTIWNGGELQTTQSPPTHSLVSLQRIQMNM